MDLKPSELMQIEVSVAYSCVIIKGIIEVYIDDTFSPFNHNIVVRIEIAGIMQKISRCMFRAVPWYCLQCHLFVKLRFSE